MGFKPLFQIDLKFTWILKSCLKESETFFYVCEYTIYIQLPIKFVDFLFVEICIYSRRFFEKSQGEISSFLTEMEFPHHFPLPKGKNDWLRYAVIIFCPRLWPRTSVYPFFTWAVEISFLHTKGCRNTLFIDFKLYLTQFIRESF